MKKKCKKLNLKINIFNSQMQMFNKQIMNYYK